MFLFVDDARVFVGRKARAAGDFGRPDLHCIEIAEPDGRDTGIGLHHEVAIKAVQLGVSPAKVLVDTTGSLFVGLTVGVIVIIGGLTFFPALALGPIVEQLAMRAGTLY